MRTVLVVIVLACLRVGVGVSAMGLNNPWPSDNCNSSGGSSSSSALDNGCRKTEATRRPCDNICSHGHCNVTVGLILSRNDSGKGMIVNLESALVELKSAESEARRRNLLDEISISYKLYDGQCISEYSTLGLLDGYTEGCAQVVFGPICDYSLASVGRIAKFMGAYGTPVITSGGFAFDFTMRKQDCNDEFYMVINSGVVDYRSYSEYMHYYMLKYEWKLVALMYEKMDQNEVGGEQSCQLLQKSIMEDMKLIENLYYHDGDIKMLNIEYRDYLMNVVGVKYGIIALCASWGNTRKILIEAESLGMMDKGEYIFFGYNIYNNATIPSKPWYDPNDSDDINERARKAFRNFFNFLPGPEAELAEVNRTVGDGRGQIFLDGIYDGMLLLSHALNDTIQDRDNFTFHGVDLLDNIFGKTFNDKYNKETKMNCNGQRMATYAMMQMNPSQDAFHIVSVYDTEHKSVTEIRDIVWVAGSAPGDIPICGYDNSKCPTEVNVTLIIICVSLGIFLTIVGVFFYRRYRLEAELAAKMWLIDYDKILIVSPNSKYRTSLSSTSNLPAMKRDSQLTIGSDLDGGSIAGERQVYTTAGYYKSIRVAVKQVERHAKIELNRCQLLEIKLLKEMSNDHIIKFHGASINDARCCILTEYCSRGSLQDILENDHINLDWMFKLSLIHDIISGMLYIHNSELRSHGNLKSTNCVVDTRFVLKLTDFGMTFLRQEPDNTDAHSFWERQLWTSPELLRMGFARRPANGTQKGDMYAFGIIVHEIIMRQGVFHISHDSLRSKREIVETVRRGPTLAQEALRPFIDDTCAHEVAGVMRRCWQEFPLDRPDFKEMKNYFQKINKREGTSNLVDNLLQRMEQYANNLEFLVDERTVDYLEEKKKCEELLYQLLPKSVATQLISGQSVIAETFDQVTIYFSDIVGFTSLSASSTPLQVVELLNDLYTCFDSIIDIFDVYKVETIGDAYMVVSGLPLRNGDQHAVEIARMALVLLRQVRNFRIRHRPGDSLQLRIGIHTGTCVAGVVGHKMPRYCLFGDTVNTASRMESTGEPHRIHVSSTTQRVLIRSGLFDLEYRGEIPVKGKGMLKTYWLVGEKPREGSSPSRTELPALQNPNRSELALDTNTLEELPPARTANITSSLGDDNDKYAAPVNNNYSKETAPLMKQMLVGNCDV